MDNEDLQNHLKAYALASKAGDTEAMNELHNAIFKHYADETAASRPENEMSGGGKFLAGVGHGIKRFYTGAGNLVGLGKLLGPDSAFSSESIKSDDEQAKPLLDTGAGMAGDIIGGIAATLPISGAASIARGGAAKLLPGATKALQGLGTGGGTLARVAGRAAQAAPTALANAAENALYGAASASPDDQGEGAVEGVGIGAALGGAGSLLKKTLGGIVKKSPDARILYDEAAREGKDLFLPIGQGADSEGLSGMLKTGYNKVLPYALGTETQMAKQMAQAKKDLADALVTGRGSPDQVDAAGRLVRVSPRIGATTQQTMANLKDVYDKAYQNTVKSYSFSKPTDFIKDVMDNLSHHNELGDGEKMKIATTLDEILSRKVDANGNINGASLTDAMKKGRTALTKMEDEVGNGAATNSAMNAFHDIVQDTIDDHKNMLSSLKGKAKLQAQETIRDLENYHKLNDSYGEASALMRTSERNIPNRGELKPNFLANEAPAGSPTQNIAQAMNEMFGDNPGVNPAGRHFLHGGAVAASALHPALAPGFLTGNAVGNLAATKFFQKGLYGDLSTQQMISRYLRNHPDAARMISSAAREAGIQNAER